MILWPWRWQHNLLPACWPHRSGILTLAIQIVCLSSRMPVVPLMTQGSPSSLELQWSCVLIGISNVIETVEFGNNANVDVEGTTSSHRSSTQRPRAVDELSAFTKRQTSLVPLQVARSGSMPLIQVKTGEHSKPGAHGVGKLTHAARVLRCARLAIERAFALSTHMHDTSNHNNQSNSERRHL